MWTFVDASSPAIPHARHACTNAARQSTRWRALNVLSQARSVCLACSQVRAAAWHPLPSGRACARARSRCQGFSSLPSGACSSRQSRQDSAHMCQGYGDHEAAWQRSYAMEGQKMGLMGPCSVKVPCHRPHLRVDWVDDHMTTFSQLAPQISET